MGLAYIIAECTFTEAAASSPDVEKVAILITDGNNTVVAEEEKEHSNGKYHSKTGTFEHISTTANQVTEEICDGMKADGIKIFTITFKVDQEETQEMLLKCATEPGFFYRVDYDDELIGAVKGIAGQLHAKDEHVVRLMR